MSEYTDDPSIPDILARVDRGDSLYRYQERALAGAVRHLEAALKDIAVESDRLRVFVGGEREARHKVMRKYAMCALGLEELPEGTDE